MPHIVVTLNILDSTLADFFVSELWVLGYESEEINEGLKAYIDADQFDENELRQLVAGFNEEGNIEIVSIEPLKAHNWNELWESNFPPVEIAEKVVIKAPFHQTKAFQYEIVMDPKMAFGTGHHETTSMMIEHLLNLPVQGKHVLDFGCGTGILGIMAAKLGAISVLAIDNDQWAYESTLENAERNHTPQVNAVLGDADAIPANSFDIILANINRHIILASLPVLHARLQAAGILLLSGILETDIADIAQTATALGLEHHFTMKKNKWVLMELKHKFEN